jgi:hypothetical protein
MIAISLALAFLPASQPKSASVPLRLKYAEGDAAKYLVEYSIKTTENLGKIGQTVSFRVASVQESGEATLSFQLSTPAMSITDKDGKEQMPWAFKLMFALATGKELTVNTDTHGAIREIKETAFGVSQEYERIMNKLVLGHLKLPDKALSKGDSWFVTYEYKSPINPEKAEVKLTYDGEVTRDGKNLQQLNIDALMFFPKRSQEGSKGTGTIFLDNEAGRIEEINLSLMQVVRHLFSQETMLFGLTVKLVSKSGRLRQ